MEADAPIALPPRGGWLRNFGEMFMPPVRTARAYTWHKARRDLVAGLTIAVVEVPQAMAYAAIAGVPVEYGLYTSIIQGIVGAMFSSSEHMATGPTNTQSLLIASAVKRLVSADTDPAMYLELVFCLTFLKGLTQLAFAAARMGAIVRYVSRSVIVGLVSGAGMLIFFGQLPGFLGISVRDPDEPPGILGPISRLLHHADGVNLHAMEIGCLTIAIAVGMRLISKFLPGALTAVCVSALLVWGLRWTDLPCVGAMPHGFPGFHLPHLTWARSEALFGGALALAMIGMLESVSIAKSIATHTGADINANQEFFSQGLTNFISSFLNCIPGSGSFTRSALDYAAGAETRFAAMLNAIFVACIFLFFGKLAQFIPRATLAGVLFVIAFGLIDWSYIPRMLRVNRSDALVCAATLLATLFTPLEYAIFIGVFLNIGLFLRKASRLHIAEMVQTDGERFQEMPLLDRAGLKRVLLLQVEGDLFFGVADELQDRLGEVRRQGVRVAILRLKRTHMLDSTVLHVLEQFVRAMKEHGGEVILCGVRTELMSVFKAYGLVTLCGPLNVIETGDSIFGSVKAALIRARQILGESIDVQPLDARLGHESFVYEI